MIKHTFQGDHTTVDTIHEIQRLAREYWSDLEGFDHFSIQRFFDVVSKWVKYVPDPPGHELVMRPKITLKRRAGDCDDKTVLMLAFCHMKGIPCGLSIVSGSPDKDFHHVFPFIYMNNRRIDIDATYAKNKFGVGRKWHKREDFPC